MTVFQTSTLLEEGPEKVFAFHENPKNIAEIAPPSMKIREVAADPQAVEGAKFRIVVAQFGITLRWTGIWEKVSRPHELVDIAEKSPFAFWRHSHLFETVGDGCRMTDRVECRLRGGPLADFVGRLLLPVFLSRMFRQRHLATRRMFRRTTPD